MRAAAMVLMLSTGTVSAAWAGGLAGSGAGAPARSPPASAVATGQDAWARVVGNTVQGRTRDGGYTEFFDAGGSVLHLDRDGKDVGRWTLRGDRLCLLFPDDDEEECRGIEVSGPNGAFIDTDGARYDFTILSGNPGRL